MAGPWGPAGSALCHYFVDEAGDAVLFDKRGKRVIGQFGCSRFFVMGCLKVADPPALAGDLRELRRQLLADVTINRVPSMTVAARKTALAFHAKDDIPEVRRDVFKRLMRHDVHFYAIVRDKAVLANAVHLRNESDPSYRYSENEVYDALVSRLFRDLLQRASHHEVVFARRGQRNRTQALSVALEKSRTSFPPRWNVAAAGSVAVKAALSREQGCLQAADYFLWAIQRFYERGDDRFLSVIWPKVCLVMDIDDTRVQPNGQVYGPSAPLTAAALAGRPGDIGSGEPAAAHTA